MDETLLARIGRALSDPGVEAMVRASRGGVPVALLRREDAVLVVVRSGAASSCRFRPIAQDGTPVFAEPFWGMSSLAHLLAARGWGGCAVEPVGGARAGARLRALLTELPRADRKKEPSGEAPDGESATRGGT